MMPTLSATQACELHCELTRWTCRQLLASGLAPVELAVAGDSTHALFSECREMGALAVNTQRGEDLGERMFNALSEGLRRARRVVLVGSDCPGLDGAYLAAAFEALAATPVVLGPAEDGGYVLIGVSRVERDWFSGVEWGEDKVLAQTLQRLRSSGAAWQLLPMRADIDRPQDLALWHQLRQLPG